MSLVLIRHTRLEDVNGLCYGHCDVPLAKTFLEEAAAARGRLPWAPDEVWASPAARCRRLAETLGAAHVVEDVRLRELFMGEWEGRKWETFRGPESEAWTLDPWRLRPPGGESAEELWRRVADVRTELLARATEERIAVVTHAGVVRAWLGIAQRRGFAEMMREPVEFGAVIEGV